MYWTACYRLCFKPHRARDVAVCSASLIPDVFRMSSGCLPDVFRLVIHLKYSSWQQNRDGNRRDHVQIATKISAYQISCVTRRDAMHRRMWQGRDIARTAIFNKYTNICIENSRVKSNSSIGFSNVEARRIFISSILFPTLVYHGSSQISVHILHTS